MTGNELLNQLDSNKASFAAKMLELNGYQNEKTKTLLSIDDMRNNVIPTAQKLVADKQKAISTATAQYSSDVAVKKTAMDVALANKNAAYNAKVQATDNTILWGDRYNKGSAWTGASGGYQGYWAGQYGALCKNDVSPSFGAELSAGVAPVLPKCVKSDSREARRKFAEQQYSSWNAKQSTSNQAYVNASAVYDKSVIDYDKQVADKNLITTANKAAADAQYYLDGLTKSGGELNKLQTRISFIDAQITSANKEIAELDNAKTAIEFNYQKFLADEITKQKVIDEQAAISQAGRQQTALLTQATIEADARDSRPKTSEEIQAQKQKVMFGVIALGLIVAGIYIIKRQN